MIPNATFPLARTSDLSTQELKDETLVYDRLTHLAHCLNPLATLVWKNCDGRRSREDLAHLVHQKLGLPADTDVIDLALDELAKNNLLVQMTTMAPEQRLYSRREISRRLGVSSAAALILAPLISSIMTQSAMAQASPPRTTTAAPRIG